MKFPQALVSGRLLRRYKRFLADVALDNGEVIIAHTANTGAMTGCAEPGSRVWLSRSDNPRRKYPYTWELVQTPGGVLCGINTLRSNALVQEAIAAGRIAELGGYDSIRREVPYGAEGSRIDLLLESQTGLAPCYVEVKNVTLVENEGVGKEGVEDGTAYFPDAVSARGSKHLRELMAMVQAGYRAVIFFCVQRQDCQRVCPADHIDARYGETLRQALGSGVEALAYQAEVSESGIVLRRALPVSVAGD
jgi:sugar fermentation stimulation protein A